MNEITTRDIDKFIKQFKEQSGGYQPIPFKDFLLQVASNPSIATRNIFQYFHDMVKTYVKKEKEEYPDDPENIGYNNYDCTELFVVDSDHRFFADRIFANRLIRIIEDMKRGAQQNKIYVYDGPHGCGKSTFLNNMIRRLQDYSNTTAGLRYEVVWVFPRSEIGTWQEETDDDKKNCECDRASRNVEISCPSHDNPILMIPKKDRRDFFDTLFPNGEFKYKLMADKEYEWLFRDEPCTICSALFEELMWKYDGDMNKVFGFLRCRPFHPNRRLGEGISVFNPGDPPIRQNTNTDPIAQKHINGLLGHNKVKYVFSHYARTNNGLFALMDIKSHNVERLIEQHNIASEGVHKVGDSVEEGVNSILFAVMNPEDKKHIQDLQSFSDRIVYVNIAYVLDITTEADIYKDVFGRHIEEAFLPRVFRNFARIIVSSRLSLRSEAMLEWIGNPEKYERYCDKNLQLLKMSIYSGIIPDWLSTEDRKKLNAKRRWRIISESENEGKHGISGRDAIAIFGDFYAQYAKPDRLINFSDLSAFIAKKKNLKSSIPDGFLDSLKQMYDYSVLQEVKESMFYYNEERIAYCIKKWMFSVTNELGAKIDCPWIKETYVVTDEMLKDIEIYLVPRAHNARLIDWENELQEFRYAQAKIWSDTTVAQEMNLENTPIEKTRQYQELFELYTKNLKSKVLDPVAHNNNFRSAIKDFGKEGFKTYDRKIQDDVRYLFGNLMKKFGYTEQGAQEIAIYVIDNDLVKKFREE